MKMKTIINLIYIFKDTMKNFKNQLNINKKYNRKKLKQSLKTPINNWER